MDQDIRSRYRTAKHSYRPTPPSHRLTKPHSTLVPERQSAQKISNKPSEPSRQPVSFEPTHPAKPAAKKPKTLRLIFILLILVGVGAAGKIWAYPKFVQHAHNPFPTVISSNISFPIFYPKQLPSGYVVDASSMQTTQNELVYNANNGSSRLVFTQQKVPAGFDFSSFYSKHLANTTIFDTPYGKVTIGKNDNRNLGSLVTDKTWLLLTTNSQQPSVDDMSLVLKNLKQY